MKNPHSETLRSLLGPVATRARKSKTVAYPSISSDIGGVVFVASWVDREDADSPAGSVTMELSWPELALLVVALGTSQQPEEQS